MSTDISTVDPVHDLRTRIANPAVTFSSDDDVQALVDYVRQQALTQSEGVDASTSAGRRTLISVAARVAKSRAFLKAQAGEVVKSLRNQVADVNARADRLVETLDEVRDSVRKPVTDWEQAEEARVTNLRNHLTSIRSLGAQAAHRFTTTEEVTKASDDFEKLVATVDFQEFAEDAQEAIRATRTALFEAGNAIEVRQKEAQEKEELKRKLAEAEAEKKKAAEAHEALRIANSLSEVASTAMDGGQDLTWIKAMREVIAPYRDNFHESVRSAYRMAKLALDNAEKEIPVPVAAKITPLPSQTSFVEPAPPAKPAITPERIAKTFLNDRDCLLELLHAAGNACSLLDELWSQANPFTPKPPAIVDFEQAIDTTEAYLKK